MQLRSIDHVDLAPAWAIAAPWLARACARPGCDLSLADLRGLVDREEALLVLILDATGAPIGAGVTQVRERADGGRSCCVLAAGGTGVRRWREIMREIEAGAVRAGCSRVEFVGRVGWAALLPDYRVDAYYVKHLEVAA
ncbi:hypothetical protein ASG40_13000 [Methylobacterium sp. Leaf399]|uniref:hypothetical protein n=1 Tax=unclassified Methylobacterium TaxID=2615210 RepID=UPI0006F717D7|nr:MULTISPECIES: hypothetical protein [unclassified Methylobacterium]KQP50838.1 hypothetical protein ASF39_11380 [Methylobacterium sp. Leaf108]KQT07819.1 hypothetical protein ASG40_13000 [Methylobacterium sp. Leaf399]KQT88934.1 hypothetical protein ASG59_13770 [Methylobacterium sp. Leaf466]